MVLMSLEIGDFGGGGCVGGGGACAAAGAGQGGCDPRRRPLLGAVSFAPDRDDRAAGDPDRDVSAPDVPQASVRAGLRDALQGGRRLVYLSPFLSDRARRTGARPDDADEADQAGPARAAPGAG